MPLPESPKKTDIEVDVVEQYGHAPQDLCTTLHWWPNDGVGKHHGAGNTAVVKDMTKAFHNYGFLYDEKAMIWYFDGVEVFRLPTPPVARRPMYILIDLALGGGWPID